MPELYNESADALTSSVEAVGFLERSMRGQCFFYLRDRSFEQVSGCDTFSGSNEDGGGINGS